VSTPPPDVEWFTPTTLADWLQLTKDYVYDQVQANQIPYHRFGRSLRFRRSEIEQWLEDSHRDEAVR
jgi:excisionase family DNA binding protein